MNLRAKILVEFSAPLTEVSEHTRRIETAIAELRKYYDVQFEIKERRRRLPSGTYARIGRSRKAPTELDLG